MNSAACVFPRPIEPRPDAMVYSSGSAVRDDVSGPGTWAFLPARLPSGETVVINAGFVQNTMQDRAPAGSRGDAAVTGAPVTLTGYHPLSRSRRRADAARKISPSGCGSPAIIWRWRGRSAGATVAPFYIDLEAPVPESGIPKPGPLEVHLKDDHLQYAITWFGSGRRGRDRVRGLAERAEIHGATIHIADRIDRRRRAARLR